LFVINNFIGPKVELEQSISQVIIILLRYINISIFKTKINELLICDGETPVSTTENLDYLFQARKIFNIEQNKPNAHWVCIPILHKLFS
jgi:hypothetical protein